MIFGYTLPDGTMLSIKQEIIQFTTDDECPSSKRLHDSEGKPILAPGEVLIFQHPSTINLCNRWRLDGTEEDYFQPGGGDGIIYLTNKRLIALRLADPWGEASQGLTLPGLPLALIDYMAERERKNLNIKQFYMLPLEEIVKLDTKYNFIFILSNLKPWHCRIRHQIMEKLIEVLKPREVTRETKGFGKWKYDYIYYIDPQNMNEKLYDRRLANIKRAAKFEKNGKTAQAIAEYKKALELFPDDKYSLKKVRVLSGEVYDEKAPALSIDAKGNSSASVTVEDDDGK